MAAAVAAKEDSVVPTRPSSLLLFVFFLLGAAAFDRDAITLPSDLILWGQLQARGRGKRYNQDEHNVVDEVLNGQEE